MHTPALPPNGFKATLARWLIKPMAIALWFREVRNSLSQLAFLMMAGTMMVLFFAVFLMVQKQTQQVLQEQLQQNLKAQAQQSFFMLSHRFQNHMDLNINGDNQSMQKSANGQGWAWLRLSQDNSTEVLSQSGHPPCTQINNLWRYQENRFDSAVAKLDCPDAHLLAFRHPTFLQEGKSRLIAVAWLNPSELISTNSYRLNEELAAIFIMGLLMAVLGGRGLAASLVSPIRTLANAAKSMADGNYSSRLSETRTDELGHLATSFNRMVDAVQTREMENKRLAYEDELTRLKNRLFFITALRERVAESKEPLVILTWDLDRFKTINDVLGFAVGDDVLRILAERFERNLSQSLFTARLGGNAFAMVTPNSLRTPLQILAGNVLKMMEEPVMINGQPLDVSATVGVSCYPEHGFIAEDLLRRAEIARFLAKRSHMRWLEYRPHFEVHSPARLSMLSELRTALQTPGQLQLYLQPKWNVPNQRLDQAEALIRWHHPTRGFIPPGEFIPFAEQTGRITELTQWAVKEALRLLQELKPLWPMTLSVNVSAQDLEKADFAEKVGELLIQSEVPADHLCMEITESGAMQEPERAMHTLMALSERGIRIAIDDFGTGYSSLSYLRRFPVNELKIDRSLVAGVGPGSEGEVILKSTVDLGHSMGMHVTAEGVETPEEWRLLSQLGIDHIQGFLFAKPMPLDAFVEFAHKQNHGFALGQQGNATFISARQFVQATQ